MSIVSFGRNTDGRDFITGDIHGEFPRLRALLDKAGFDEARDRLFTVGDLVDRGPESLQALEWLDQPWFHSTRGNHEQMAINFADGHNHAFQYERNGGRWFIDLPPFEQQRIARRFEMLPLAIEVEAGAWRVGIVHAEVPYNEWSSLQADTGPIRDTALWSRERFDKKIDTPVTGIDKVFVGHTPLDQPLVLGNVAYIDSGAVFGGVMLLLCLSNGSVWGDR